MKIVRIETYATDEVAAVRLFTDNGLEGLGQTGCYGARHSAALLHEMLAPLFLGRNPWDLQALVREAQRATYKFAGTFLCRALCGIDTALYDLLGQATGQPVYRLLGGALRREIPMYASSMTRASAPEAEVAFLEEVVARDGFRGVKVKIGQRMGMDADAMPGRSERLITLLRDALPDTDLSADGNGGFSVARAVRMGRLLEAHGYYHFEEPCPYPQLENTSRVAAALDIPVSGGEQDNVLEHFQRMIHMQAVDIVQFDIGYLGGITRARRIAEMAESAGMPCMPHCANRSLVQVFTLHLCASMLACYPYQEWRVTEDRPWAERIYEPLPRVVGGTVTLSDAPGWGVRLREDFRRAATQQVSDLGAAR